MNDWRQRSVVAAFAGAALGGGVLASFNACSLDSNGLIPLDGGRSEASIASGDDATVDAAQRPETSADVARGDACGAVETDCLDGLDDDCNGLVDCADPACGAGYACVPAPTGGFAGFAVYDDDRSAPCAAPYATQSDTFETLIFFPASCAPCSCEAHGAACGAATLTCSSSGVCPVDGGESAAVGESCIAPDAGLALGPSVACEVSAPSATAGTCTVDGGAAAITPVAIAQLSRVCAAAAGPGGGCGAAAVCVARPPSGSHGACVYQTTDAPLECPAGYTNAHTTLPSATSLSDTRACTSCSCGGPTGASCAGSLALYPGGGCGDAGDDAAAAIALPADGGCTSATGATTVTIGSAILSASVVSEGTCASTGGQPTGTVTPKDQTLVCCQN